MLVPYLISCLKAVDALQDPAMKLSYAYANDLLKAQQNPNAAQSPGSPKKAKNTFYFCLYVFYF